MPWDEPRIKSPDVIERMRRAGSVAAEILRLAGEAVRPGVTTEEIDAYVHDLYIERGAYPSPLNYHGYPKSLCTSVNEVICHGIPDSRVLLDGDIVNLDVTAYIDGVHGDTNATFYVGDVDPVSRRLTEVTEECMWHGIEAVVPGRPLSDIGKAIEQHAKQHRYGVVRAFIGHGIGEQFHTDVQVFHYYEPRANMIMRPGMTFTIEPMITLGTWQHRMWDDGWTAVTTDGKRTAQYEHTVLVTDAGVDVLTGGTGAVSPVAPWHRVVLTLALVATSAARCGRCVATMTSVSGGDGDDGTGGRVDGESVQVDVRSAWARSSPPGVADGAAYLTIESAEDDQLVGALVPADVAAAVELHETVARRTDRHGAASMTMQQVSAVELPAGEAVAFEPGGLHVMLVDLAGPLESGSSFELTLILATSEPKTVTVDVRDEAP